MSELVEKAKQVQVANRTVHIEKQTEKKTQKAVVTKLLNY
jgi:hypothetical protein